MMLAPQSAPPFHWLNDEPVVDIFAVDLASLFGDQTVVWTTESPHCAGHAWVLPPEGQQA